VIFRPRGENVAQFTKHILQLIANHLKLFCLFKLGVFPTTIFVCVVFYFICRKHVVKQTLMRNLKKLKQVLVPKQKEMVQLLKQELVLVLMQVVLTRRVKQTQKMYV